MLRPRNKAILILLGEISMTKKTKSSSTRKILNKVEKFYIENNCMELSLAEIQSDLKLTKTMIEKYYNQCKETKQKELDKQAEENIITAGKLMNRKQDRGVVVMTKESSQWSDENRTKAKINEKSRQHIHRFREE